MNIWRSTQLKLTLVRFHSLFHQPTMRERREALLGRGEVRRALRDGGEGA
jgi:hypothetical protein